MQPFQAAAVAFVALLNAESAGKFECLNVVRRTWLDYRRIAVTARTQADAAAQQKSGQ